MMIDKKTTEDTETKETTDFVVSAQSNDCADYTDKKSLLKKQGFINL